MFRPTRRAAAPSGAPHCSATLPACTHSRPTSISLYHHSRLLSRSYLPLRCTYISPPHRLRLSGSRLSSESVRQHLLFFRKPSTSRRSSSSRTTPESDPPPHPYDGIFASKGYEQLIRISQTSYVRYLLRGRFLRGVCKRTLAKVPSKDFEPFCSKVDALQQELIQENSRFSFMKADAKDHLFVAALVLATYRTLLQRTSDEAMAIEVVQGSFMEQLDVFYNVIVPLYITKHDDELARLESALKTHTRVMGDSFDVSFVRSPSGFSAIVRRCFFNDFFEANRSSFLMGPIFCTADNMWKAVLPPAKYIQYKRPSTLAAGGKTCHFMFKCKETVEEKAKAQQQQKQLQLGYEG